MVDVQRVHYSGLDSRLRIYRCDEVSVDSFAVLTERFVVILDTLVSRDMMRGIVEELAPGPQQQCRLLVVNTHGDWDHVWGNGLFAGPGAEYPAPVIGHELIAARIHTAEARAELEEKRAESSDYATAEWIPPSIAIGGPTRIEGGDLTLHLLPTPGHKPDHLAVWIPELRLLFAGDAAEWPYPRVDDDLSVFRSSLRRMRDLQPDTVLYCHAPGRTDAGVIEENLAYFGEMERRAGSGQEWAADDVIPVEITRPDLRSMYESFHQHNMAVARALSSR